MATKSKRSQKLTKFRLTTGRTLKAILLPKRARKISRSKPLQTTISPAAVAKALVLSPGATELFKSKSHLAKPVMGLIATFSVCQKMGTARYLDIWDADHFDYFTDMHRNLAECRVWFSDKGFTYWDSPETRTGRINCYFRAPSNGEYVCNVELQSYGGQAMVECLMDDFNFGPLPINGSILQPHHSTLDAGYHSFRVRQKSGSFFFNSLTVWKL